MREQNFSKRELEHFFQDMKSDIKEILVDGKETKVQAYKTNGTVKSHKLYFKILWWFFGTLGTLLILTLPSIIKFVSHINQLSQTVDSITTKYNIK